MPLVIAVLSNINYGSYLIAADDSQSPVPCAAAPGQAGHCCRLLVARPCRPRAPTRQQRPPGSSSPSSAPSGCNVADPAMSTAPQLGPGSNPLPNLSESSASGVPHGAAPGLRSEAAGGGGGGTGKQPSQFVYVFTTHLANT